MSSPLRYARVAKQVDARDLKSLDGNIMPVRLRPRAPRNTNGFSDSDAKNNRTREILSKCFSKGLTDFPYSVIPGRLRSHELRQQPPGRSQHPDRN